MNNRISVQSSLHVRRNRHLWMSALFAAVLAGNFHNPVFAQNFGRHEPTLKELISKLDDEDIENRLWTVREIAMCDLYSGETETAIAVLQGLLGDSSGVMRIAAARALWDLDQPATMTLSVVVQGLHDKDPEGRNEAAQLILSFGHQASSAIEEIVMLSGESDAEIRDIAASVLGEFGPDHKSVSIPPLTRLLDDPDPYVRSSAATSLAAVDGPLDRAVATLVELLRENNRGNLSSYGAIESIGDLGIDGADAIPDIIETIKLEGVNRQIDCSIALGKMGPLAKSAIDILAVKLRDGETHGAPFVHHTWCLSDDASNALAKIGIDAVPVLLAALNDSVERVRANAANALGDIPDAAAQSIPALIKCLDDPAVPVRAVAAWSLGKIGSKAESATPQLVQILFDESEWSSAPSGGGIAQTFSLPWHAVEAISRIRPDSKLLASSFESALNDESVVTFAAATTIAAMGASANSLIPKLARLLKEPTSRASAAFAIASVDPDYPGLQNALEESLVDGQGEIDRVAVRGLGLLEYRAIESIPKLENVIRIGGESEFFGGCGQMILAAISILKIDISNTHASDVLLQALFESHYVFNGTEIKEAMEVLPDFAVRQEYLRTKLIGQLQFQMVDSGDGWTEAEINGLKKEVRLRAATILTAARIATPETLEALRQLCIEGKYRIRGGAADLLGRYGAEAKGQVEELARHLAETDIYTIGGDFYGNGGTRHTVADHIVNALAVIGLDAVPVLIEKLNDPYHIVRANAARSLSLIGSDAEQAIDALISHANDPSHLVRTQVAVALGKVAGANRGKHQEIRASLRVASNDTRPSVRVAANDALRGLGD